MPSDEKSEIEPIEKLEAELRKKTEEMEKILQGLHSKMQSGEEMKRITAIKGLETKLQAVKEMQMEILQKKDSLETAPQRRTEGNAVSQRTKGQSPEGGHQTGNGGITSEGEREKGSPGKSNQGNGGLEG